MGGGRRSVWSHRWWRDRKVGPQLVLGGLLFSASATAVLILGDLPGTLGLRARVGRGEGPTPPQATRLAIASSPSAPESPLPLPAWVPSPLPTEAPSARPTAKQSPAPLPSASPTAKPSPAPRPSASPTAKPSPAPRPSASPTAKPSPAPRPLASPTAKPSPAPRPLASPTAKPSPAAKPSASPRPSASPSLRPSPAPRPSPRALASRRPLASPPPRPTGTGRPALRPSPRSQAPAAALPALGGWRLGPGGLPQRWQGGAWRPWRGALPPRPWRQLVPAGGDLALALSPDHQSLWLLKWPAGQPGVAVKVLGPVGGWGGAQAPRLGLRHPTSFALATGRELIWIAEAGGGLARYHLPTDRMERPSLQWGPGGPPKGVLFLEAPEGATSPLWEPASGRRWSLDLRDGQLRALPK